MVTSRRRPVHVGKGVGWFPPQNIENHYFEKYLADGLETCGTVILGLGSIIFHCRPIGNFEVGHMWNVCTYFGMYGKRRPT